MMDSGSEKFKEFHWIMSLLQSIDVGVIVLDRDYKVQVWNSFMENHSGIRPEKIRGNNLFKCFSEIPADWFKRKTESVFLLHNHSFSTWENRPYLFKFKNYRPITSMEEFMYQNITIIPLTSLDSSVQYVCVLVYDVTDIALSKKELQSLNKKLEHQSHTDSLTQLNNRGYWEECMKKEYKRFLRTGSVSSLVMFDIDHFKNVNDTYGHQIGDDVIYMVSQVLRECVRETDIAGRYGGEEFCVILLDSNAESSLAFAERLRENIMNNNSVKHQGETVNVTVSLGIAETKESMRSYGELIECADKGLYQSKDNGRNQTTIYSPEKLKVVV